MSRVTVAFLTLDEHGTSTGRCEAVRFVSDEHGNVDLTCQMRRGQVFKEKSYESGAQTVQLGRREFSCWGWRSMYGNVFWEATGMGVREAERLLRYLLACGYGVDGYDEGTFSAIIEEHEKARAAREEAPGEPT